MEKWIDIIGWESSYEVSDLGNVRNKRTQRILIPIRTGKNRSSGKNSKVRFSTNPRKDYSVAHLVLTHFNRPKKDKEVVMHLNDDTTDNRLVNLRWGTYQENMRDCAIKMRIHKQKLSRADIQIIRICRSIGMQGRALAKLFNVSEQRICDVYKNRSALGEM